jgi:uncharacterized membrane protein
VCHQLSSRSLDFGSVILPVCSRCSGFYTGFLVTIVILFLMFRKKESDLPPGYILIILFLFFLFFFIDGIASNFGLYSTNNNLRFASGFLFGSSIAIIIYPIFIFQYYKNTKTKKLFDRPLNFLIYSLVIFIFIVVTLLRLNFLGYFYYYLTGFSIIFTFYFINLVMVFLIPAFSQKARNLLSKYLILPSVISITLVFMELIALFLFHRAVSNLQVAI